MAWWLGVEGADESWANHLLSRRHGCGLVSSSLRTSNGLDGTSPPGSAEASEVPKAAGLTAKRPVLTRVLKYSS